MANLVVNGSVPGVSGSVAAVSGDGRGLLTRLAQRVADAVKWVWKGLMSVVNWVLGRGNSGAVSAAGDKKKLPPAAGSQTSSLTDIGGGITKEQVLKSLQDKQGLTISRFEDFSPVNCLFQSLLDEMMKDDFSKGLRFFIEIVEMDSSFEFQGTNLEEINSQRSSLGEAFFHCLWERSPEKTKTTHSFTVTRTVNGSTRDYPKIDGNLVIDKTSAAKPASAASAAAPSHSQQFPGSATPPSPATVVSPTTKPTPSAVVAVSQAVLNPVPPAATAAGAASAGAVTALVGPPSIASLIAEPNSSGVAASSSPNLPTLDQMAQSAIAQILAIIEQQSREQVANARTKFGTQPTHGWSPQAKVDNQSDILLTGKKWNSEAKKWDEAVSPGCYISGEKIQETLSQAVPLWQKSFWKMRFRFGFADAIGDARTEKTLIVQINKSPDGKYPAISGGSVAAAASAAAAPAATPATTVSTATNAGVAAVVSGSNSTASSTAASSTATMPWVVSKLGIPSSTLGSIDGTHTYEVNEDDLVLFMKHHIPPLCQAIRENLHDGSPMEDENAPQIRIYSKYLPQYKSFQINLDPTQEDGISRNFQWKKEKHGGQYQLQERDLLNTIYAHQQYLRDLVNAAYKYNTTNKRMFYLMGKIGRGDGYLIQNGKEIYGAFFLLAKFTIIRNNASAAAKK